MHLLHKNKTVGIITIVAGLIAFSCIALSAIAVNYHFEAFNDPSIILSLQGVSAIAGKWSMIGDTLGYYMLMLPLIFYFQEWMKNKTPWSSVFTFCGLAYVLIGAIGASILSVIWPSAMQAYPVAPPVEQQIIKANFEVVNTMIYGGMWNLLEQLFAGIWWILPGYLLFKQGYKRVAVAGIITGLFSLLDSFSGMISNNNMHQMALNGYLYLSVIWTIWMGVVIYRKPMINTEEVKEKEKPLVKRKAIAKVQEVFNG